MRKINVIKTVIAAAVMTAALGILTGCSVEKNFTKTETHTVTDANGNTTTTTTSNNNGEVTTETTVEESKGSETEAVEGVGDIIEEIDYEIFDNDVFSFEYNPDYFVVIEDEEYVTVSFYNEETQTAGSNTITFNVMDNTNAMDVLKDYAKQYGVDEEIIHESYFGKHCVESYVFSIFPEAESVMENQTRSMVCAVPNGNNVILIEVLTHVEPDEGMDMFINDSIAGVLDSFTIR